MSADDFQTRYASVMESMVRSAVAETTKLFETMVDDLKAEISRIKKENEDLKSRCNEFENAINHPINIRESELGSRLSIVADKRDTAIQCDLVPLQAMLAEHSQSQQGGCRGMEQYVLKEQNHEIHEEGNSQMAHVKQEEEDVPIGVCREVFGDIAGLPGTSASGIEAEGPFISQTYSKEELDLLQKDEETTVALGIPYSAVDHGLSCLGVQSKTPESEQQLVISLTAVKDTAEESLVSQQIPETWTQSEIKAAEEQPLDVVRQQLASELPEKEQPTDREHQVVISHAVINDGNADQSESSPQILATWTQAEIKTSEQQPLVIIQQRSVDEPLQTREQMSDKTIPSTSQWSKEKVTSSSSSVQEAGNIPMKDKNEINGSVLPVSTAFSGRGHSSRKVKQPESQHLLMEVGKEAVQSSTQVPSAVETTKTPLIESPEEPASQLRATSSNKILSIMEAAKMPVRKLDKLNVTSPPVSTASLSTEHSLEKEKLSETQQQKEEEAIPSPSIRGLSASETCNAPSTKAPQAGLVQPKEHHTSHASLQDALLFVEAMSAQTLGYESVKNASSQTQNASHLVTLKADTEVPAKLPNSLLPQTPGSPITAKITIRTHQAAGNEPTIKQATTSKSTAPIFSAGSQTTVVSPTNVAQAHKKRVVIPFTATATPMTSTVITQKSVTFQQCLASRNIKVVAPSKAPRNTSSQNIIIVPRHLSSVSPHTVSPLSETQLASIVSTVASRKYSLSPASKAAGLAMPSLSSVPLKTIVVASKQSLPIVTSHTTATSTLAHPKFKILVPRQVPVEASRQQLSSLPQKTILTRRQEPVETAPSVAVSLAQPVSSSQQPSISVDSQTISGEKTTTLPQQKENISENSESHKQTASVTKTTNVLTETRLNSESSFSPELVQTSVSPAVPPTSQSQPKLSAVIKLTRLPFSLTAKESVLVQKTLKGSTEVLSFVRNSPNVSTISVTTHEKPSLVKSTKSSLTRPNSQACQLSEKPNDIQTCQLSEKPNNLKEKTVKNTHLFSAVSERKSAPTESPAAFLDTPVSEMSITSCDSSLDLDSNKDFVKHNNPLGTQEKSSDLPIRLTSIISKDTSDAHAQMSKIQFLAQLAVSPVDQVQQEAFSSDAVDARAASAETSTNDSTPLQKDSLVARLRNHLKTCLRPEKPEPLKETEAPVNSKRPRLADVVTDSPTQSALTDNVASFKDTTKDSNSISPRISRLCKGGVRSKKIVSRASSVSPRRSSLTKDSASPKKTATSVSPRRRDLTRAGASPNKITSESTAVGLRRSSTRNDAKAKIKCEADSPSAKSSRFANDGIRPKKTKESTPAMKPKLIQDATNSKKSLKVANAKKLAKAEKSKLTTLRKSKQKLQQKIQLRESNTNCETVKKCKSKAVWTPPRIPVNTSPQTKGSSLSPIPAKSERSQNTGQSSTPTNRSQIVKSKGTQSSPCTVVFPPSVSLHPIPVKAPPIVSPLQPLSVIGRRLLRNQCGECGRVLSSPAALESHVSLHTGHRPFSCTLCGKGFPDSKGLKRHGRVHRNGRIHICPQCGKGFVYRFSLTKHIQMVHNRMKPFPCPVCNKGFFTKRDVEGHVRMHTGEKPFHCNLCEKKFARRVELNMHLRWHNGEKRHWCPYCGKGFLDSNNLKRHKYIHTGERPHACPHCSKHFTQSGHLKKHLKNVHKVE